MSYLPPIFQQNNQYSARVTRQLLDDIATEGVVGPGAFAVTERGAGAAMAVDVAAGRAYVRGTDQSNQGLYLCITEATVELPVEPADPSLDRIDLVVAEVRDPNAGGVAGDDWRFRVIEGTPDASPVAPALPDSAIPLAEIEVDANVTSILDVDITDLRGFSDAKSGGVGFVYAGTRYYTSSGTFEKADPLGTGDIGLRAIRVRVLGAGGGGGGAAATAASRNAIGVSGGGGGFAERTFTDIAALDAITPVVVGLGGPGGAAGNNAGSAGGVSEFGDTGDAWLTRATGGAGGLGGVEFAVGGAISGAVGGVGTHGDFVLDGGASSASQYWNIGTVLSSQPGAGAVFGASLRMTAANANGAVGFLGSGGEGGKNSQNQATARAGGAGGDGVIIVDCFV